MAEAGQHQRGDGVDGDGVDGDGWGESPDERSVDERFRALLEGLRTTLPASETLAGFLLIIPFQGAFDSFDALARGAYYVAFFSAVLATVLLIAPAAHQRLRAPVTGVERTSMRDLRITVWITIAGTLSLSTALTTAVFIVSRALFTSTAAGVAAGSLVAVTAWAWFYVPMVTFNRD